MLKKVLLSVVPMFLLVTMAVAEDDVLKDFAGLDVGSIQDAAISIEGLDLDGLDVDGLASNAGTDKSDDAIEACFRRFGYGGGHCYNHWGYGHGYGYGCYTHVSYYQPFYCYRPVTYYACVPTYTYYWGCY